MDKLQFLVLITVIARGGDYRGDGGTRPPKFWLGDAKVNVPPLIAHLVKFLGHIFHLDNWITALVECRCIVFHIYNSEMLILHTRASVSLAVRAAIIGGRGDTSPTFFLGGQHFGSAPRPPPFRRNRRHWSYEFSSVCCCALYR